MDKLKQKGKECKIWKASLLRRVDFTGTKAKFSGASHISEDLYGKTLGDSPLTNRYVKKFKRELKAEYRAVKRSEKQEIRKAILQSIEED